MTSKTGGKPKRSRWLRLLQVAGTTLVLFALILPLIFTLLLSIASERSYVIEARTSSLELHFTAQQPDWRLADTVICSPVAVPRLAAEDDCGAATEPVAPRGEVLPQWSEGDRVRLTIDPNGSLRVTALTDTQILDTGGFLLVSPDGWNRSGALLVRAHVTLGQALASGATRNYLWSGTWEAREAARPALLFGTGTKPMQDGTFTAGTRVRILSVNDTGDITPALSFGHIASRSRDPVMDVSFVSEFADTALWVQYDGVPEPVITKPSWVDVALRSPLLIALASIFPILTSLGLVVSDLTRRLEPPNTLEPRNARATSNHLQTRKILRELKRRN